MMKLKKSEFWIILGEIFYVISTYIFNHKITTGITDFGFYKLQPNSIWFSFVHAFLAASVIIYFFNIVQKTITRNTRSMTFIFYYVICIYNMCSACKYIISPLFPGLVSNNYLRLLGSFLADVVIMISLFLWDIINSNHYDSFFYTDKHVCGNRLLTFVMIVLYAIKVINTNIVIFPFLNIENKTLDDFINTFLCLLCMSMVIANTKISLKKIIGLLPILMIFLISASNAIFTGKRNDLIVPIVYFIAICYGMGKMNVRLLRTLTAVVPIGISIVSQFIFAISGRYTSVNLWYVRDQVYRFDLTDFAITIASRFHLNDISFATIKDGIIASIPGISWESFHYRNFMEKIGLRAMEDYSDTIFSVGAELFGLLGIIVIPILFLIYLEWLDNCFKRSKYYYVRYTRFVIVSYYTIVETTWAGLILCTRNMLLAVLLGIVILRFVLSKKKKRKYIFKSAQLYQNYYPPNLTLYKKAFKKQN